MFQFLFNIVGYLVMTLLWTSYRGDSLPAGPADPVTGIINNILSDQSAVNTIFLPFGYVS